MIKVAFIQSLEASRTEAQEALEGAFAPFGSLAPIAPAVAEAMLAVVDGDTAALGRLAETLESVPCEHIASLRWGVGELALVTPTSQTEIRLRKAQTGYNLLADFGEQGSTHRATMVQDAFEAAGLECRQRTV